MRERTGLKGGSGREGKEKEGAAFPQEGTWTEAARDEEVRLFRVLADNSSDLICICDPTGTRTYVSPSHREILGYETEELVGDSILSLVHPDDLARTAGELEEGLGGVGPGLSRVRNRRADGRYIWLESKGTPLLDAGGKVAGGLVVSRDITERIAFEESLKASGEEYRSLVESTGAGVATTDAEGRIVYVNPALCEMLGWEKNEIIGRRFSDFLHPSDLQEVKDAAAGISTAPSGRVDLGFRLVRKDGRLVDCYTSPTISHREGVITGYQAIVIDVTPSVRAEREKREWRELLFALLENAPAAIYINSPEDRYLMVNRAWEELTGRRRESALGRRLGEVMTPEFARRFEEENERIRHDRETLEFEEKLEFAGGQIYFHTVKFPVLDEDGGLVAIGGISIDITEGRRYREEMEESEMRLRALAARLQEVREEERAAIALELHDQLGQALTGLRLDLAWLQRHLPGDRDDWRDKMASMAGLLESTIQDVRRLSADLRPSLLDDFGLVPALEWLAQDFSGRTGVECSISAEPGDLELDRAVSTVLFRVTQEALTNVARHAHARRVDIRMELWEGELRLEVSDDGSGIPLEKIDDRSSLGLLGMRERVAALGGGLEISRREGGGTRVTARLPLASGKREEG